LAKAQKSLHAKSAKWLCSIAFLIVTLLVISWSQRRTRSVIEGDEQRGRIADFHRMVSTGDTQGIDTALRISPGLINSRDNLGRTPLMVALLASRVASSNLVPLLLRHGADVNAYDVGRETPLMVASQKNDLASVRLLLNRGAEINAKDVFERTALDVATYRGASDITQELITSGAAENIFDAVFSGDAELTRQMLDANPGLVHIRKKMPPLTPLEAALLRKARHNDDKVLSVILRYDPPLDFWKAAALGQEDLVRKYLAETPLILDEKDLTGRTALEWCIETRDTHMASLLLDHGAPAQSEQLAAAIRTGNREMVRLLLSYGADPQTLIPGMGTPYAIAVRAGRKDMSELLKK